MAQVLAWIRGSWEEVPSHPWIRLFGWQVLSSVKPALARVSKDERGWTDQGREIEVPDEHHQAWHD